MNINFHIFYQGWGRFLEEPTVHRNYKLRSNMSADEEVECMDLIIKHTYICISITTLKVVTAAGLK